jgi:hypothetical protein
MVRCPNSDLEVTRDTPTRRKMGTYFESDAVVAEFTEGVRNQAKAILI